MNIIFLLNSRYPYYTGGRETWLNNVCNRLCDKHNISIITEKNSEKSNYSGTFTNVNPRINIYPVSSWNNIRFLKPFLRSYLGWLNQEYSAKQMQKKLKKLLLQENGEKVAVITMDTVFMGKVGRWAKKYYKNVQLISSVRSPHAEITGDYYPLLKKRFLNVEKKNLNSADEIWANGWDTQDNLRAKGFESTLIKNGLDISRAIPIQNDQYNDLPLIGSYNIITIGSLIDIKGYKELIEAISKVHKEYGMKVNLVALGKGNPQRYLSYASDFDIKEYINFVGEKRETIEYAQRFDIVACLSGGSGLSMACLEAMASQTPVIAWNTAVYQQMITHKKSGYLVNYQDVDALAKGICWLLTHKSESKSMGFEAYNTAKQFDWSIVIESIEQRLMNLNSNIK